MFRRSHAPRFARRAFRAREPLVWQRFVQPLTPASGVLTGLAVGQPSLLFASASTDQVQTDARWTLKRLILWITLTGDAGITGAASVALGVEVIETGTVVDDPLLSTADDHRVDWMHLSLRQADVFDHSFGGGAGTTRVVGFKAMEMPIIIKTQRHVTNSEQVALAVVQNGITTPAMTVMSSALWSRTPR